MSIEWRRDDYVISTERERLDVDLIHKFLSESSYWAIGRPLEVVRRSIEHSLAFGIYQGERQQIGFARVITDYATFAWIADVFVLEEFRGRGLGKWLVEIILGHPSCRRFVAGCWRRKTRMNSIAPTAFRSCSVPNAGWSAMIRRQWRSRTTGRVRLMDSTAATDQGATLKAARRFVPLPLNGNLAVNTLRGENMGNTE
jgi:GNAT superfamily N-acetyltransferase